MITIIDYGMGNLRSVHKAFEKIGSKTIITRDQNDIRRAERLVLPGVGAFRDCMSNLRQYGLIEPITEFIMGGKPYLGICLGLQILFTESEEYGHEQGLNLISGLVVRFQDNMGDSERTPYKGLKVPHMGWNKVHIKEGFPLFKGIGDGAYFYFVHSFYVVPKDEGVIASRTEYGIQFTSSIWKDNIFACQFHPEKSQSHGLQLLKNFTMIK